MPYCVKNKKTGMLLTSTRTMNQTTARSRCADLNRKVSGSPYTVVKCR